MIFLFLCFRFDALTELGAFMRTEFSCFFSVLRVTSGPRVKLAGRKSALTQLPPPPSGGLLYWQYLGGGPGVSLSCSLSFLFY